MRYMTALIALGLAGSTAGTCLAAAESVAGDWFNGEMTVTLAVSGTSVTGTFSMTTGGRSGEVSGQLLNGSPSARLEFRWREGEEEGQFGALLAPSARGRLLQGSRWDASGVLTSLGLHRRTALAPADLPDEDTDLGALPPPTTPSTPTTPTTPKPPVVTPAPPAAPPARPDGAEVLIFDNGNPYGVDNQPTKPTVFTTRQGHYITLIRNYHWNHGRGAIAGTIALRSADGRTYGPWQAKNAPGSGRQNVLWLVEPEIILPPGTYTVLDSDPATWAQNAASGNAGNTLVNGIPLEDLSITPAGDSPGFDPNEVDADPDIEPPATLPKLSLQLCTALQDNKPVSPRTRFTKPTKLYCWTDYAGLPADTVVTCVWVGNGKALATSERALSGSGWVWFSYATTSPAGLAKGKYAVKLRVGATVIGYQDFVVE